jgi:glycosyltransferase involved in cell wall biosynthesis
LSRQIAIDIDSGAYDVVWIEPSQWTQAPPVLLYLNTPCLYSCHEAPRHLYESVKIDSKSDGRLPWLNKIDPLIRLYRQTARKLDLEATRAADTVLVNSKFSQKNVENLYSIEVEIGYNGVDTDVFHIVESCPKQRFVLSVGALQPLKGFDFLIESVSLIPASNRPLLKILGNSETPGYRAALENLAKEKGVKLCIEIGLRLEELVCQYNKAAVFVYAPYNEPFGLAPLEAMACGSPVLGVAEGGVMETVVDGVNGRLLSRDPNLFAITIQSLLDDSKLSQQLAENGREYVVNNWSWDKAVANMEFFLMETAAVNLETMLMRSF